MANRKFELKLFIEKKSQKVLFAQVQKDMVDFLFSLLSLPIGSVAKLLTEESTFGPLRNTYLSWEQLGSNFLSSSRMTANSLINPVISPNASSNFARLLSSTSPATEKEKVHGCNCNCNFTDVSCFHSTCKSCGVEMQRELSYVGPRVTKEAVESDGYVKDGFTYAVMDDLSIVPMTPSGCIAFLNKMGHKSLSLIEEKTVSLNVLQGLELLRTSLNSKNVLTDMFLTKKMLFSQRRGLKQNMQIILKTYPVFCCVLFFFLVGFLLVNLEEANRASKTSRQSRY